MVARSFVHMGTPKVNQAMCLLSVVRQQFSKIMDRVLLIEVFVVYMNLLRAR